MDIVKLKEQIGLEIRDLTKLYNAINGMTVEGAVRVVREPFGSPALTQNVRPRRIMSVAARRKIAAAQRARWAKAKSLTKSRSTPKAKPKRIVGVTTRRKLAAAAKLRWAKVKKAAKTKASKVPKAPKPAEVAA